MDEFKNEISCLNASRDLWNSLLALDQTGYNTSDMSDLLFHIHAIQNILLARVGSKTISEIINREQDYLNINNMEQQELKLPTVGRQVHYYPCGDEHCKYNGAEILPATVMQVFNGRINLAVTCMNPDGFIVIRYSVTHESTVIRDDNGNVAEGGYWAWPEIK